MNNDNTYKLALGRALLECLSFNKYKVIDDDVIIEFDNISECMIKYYWNQLFFFNLKQSPYKEKYPVICNDALKLIYEYKIKFNTVIPILFDEVKNKLDSDFNNSIVKHVSKTLHKDVCWRFMKINKSTIDLYRYNKSDGSFIIINNNELELLKEYSIILSKLLNYKWAQLLENLIFVLKLLIK